MVATAIWNYLPWHHPDVHVVPECGLSPVYTLRCTHEVVEEKFRQAIDRWYETYLTTTQGYKIHVHWWGEARLLRGHKVQVLDITSHHRKQKYKNLQAFVWQAHHKNPVIGFVESAQTGW